MGEKWFIEREGVAYGPADVSELSAWITEGRLDWSDMLWPESADRGTAIPAHTALQALGLVVPPSSWSAEVAPNPEEQVPTTLDEEIPVLESGEDTFEIPMLPAPLVSDEPAPTTAADAAAALLEKSYDIPMLPAPLAKGKSARKAAAKPTAAPDWLESVQVKAPTDVTPVPDWLKSLADGLEAERSKPKTSSPDWIEDVRQLERGAGLPLPIPGRTGNPEKKDPPKKDPPQDPSTKTP